MATTSVAREPKLKTDRYEDDPDEESLLFGFDAVEGVARTRHNHLERHRRRKMLLTAAGIAGVLGGIALVVGLVYGLRGKKHTYVCPHSFNPSGADATFFIIGDWGREGITNQQDVARMMGELGECFKPSWVISTGDNFYDHGLMGPQDPTFAKSFTNVYTAPSLQVPWYAVLGNHDHGDTLTRSLVQSCSAPSIDQCPAGCCYSPLWQSNMTAADWRWNLRQGAWTLSLLGGQLDITMIDTSPLIPRYRTKQWASIPGGVGSVDAEASKASILGLLQNSTAPWKLVVGHHPVRSYGEHCLDPAASDCEAMSFIKPWLAQNRVAAYLCGHDHDIQVIKVKDSAPVPDPVYYVVSGGGSNIRDGEFNLDPATTENESDFLADLPGFVAASLSGDTLNLWVYVRSSPTPVYAVSIPRPGSTSSGTPPSG